MRHERSHKWSEWRNTVQVIPEQRTRALGINSFPVPLKRIAEAQGIRHVVFRPLLVDGGIAPAEEGFVLFVGCSKQAAEEWQRSFELDEGRSLPPRVRFTIAHELTHTLFFDRNSSPPRSRLSLKSGSEIASLESACNLGAGHWLLPDYLLAEAIRTMDLFNPVSLIDFAKVSGVSLSTLLIRLQNLEKWTDSHGALFLASVNGETVIRACASDPLCRSIWPKPTESKMLPRALADERLCFNGGSSTDTEILMDAVVSERPIRQPARVRCVQSSRGSFVVTIQLLQDARKGSDGRALAVRHP